MPVLAPSRTDIASAHGSSKFACCDANTRSFLLVPCFVHSISTCLFTVGMLCFTYGVERLDFFPFRTGPLVRQIRVGPQCMHKGESRSNA
jgi:hypothetical protein